MAMNLSQDPRVRGIILEGAVSNDEEMIEFFINRNRLGSLASVTVDPKIKFDNYVLTERFQYPMLIIHGEDDENIPAWMSKKLYEGYQGDSAEFVLVEGGGHCDTFHIAPAFFEETISVFISKVVIDAES